MDHDDFVAPPSKQKRKAQSDSKIIISNLFDTRGLLWVTTEFQMCKDVQGMFILVNAPRA